MCAGFVGCFFECFVSDVDVGAVGFVVGDGGVAIATAPITATTVVEGFCFYCLYYHHDCCRFSYYSNLVYYN